MDSLPSRFARVYRLLREIATESLARKSRMDSLELIRAFREVAAKGSFSRAATRLNVSTPTVSKYISELEGRFGVRLFHRSTRSVSLTDAGTLLFERSTPVLQMIEVAQTELKDHAGTPQGRLKISASHDMGHGNLPGLLAEFMGCYPEVHVSLQFTNRVVDLAEEGVDVALCFGPVADENLIVRPLLLIDMVVCASPGYWRKHGKPKSPGDLARHDALTKFSQGQPAVWGFQVDGKPVEVAIRSRMDATELAPLIDVALRGYGVLYVPALLVQSRIDKGELEAVLQENARSDLWLSAAYLQRRYNSAALRALLDFMTSRVKSIGKSANSHPR